jgi:hypothetical protein
MELYYDDGLAFRYACIVVRLCKHADFFRTVHAVPAAMNDVSATIKHAIPPAGRVRSKP